MVLKVEDFSMNIEYNSTEDVLNLSSDRDLKNGDLLLILIHLLSMVELEHRTDILDIALSVIKEKENKSIN